MRKRVDFELAGETYEVTPTFATIDRIESRVSLMDIIRSIDERNLKLSDAAWIIHSVLQTAGYKLSYEDVGDMVMDDFWSGQQAAANIAAAAITGGQQSEQSKKKK